VSNASEVRNVSSYRQAQREWERIRRETPFLACDHTDLYATEHQGGTAFFATRYEALAWLWARGDCGNVRQLGVGVVYSGEPVPPADPH
jgi:hypothetical protein